MATVSELQTRLESLKKARDSGVAVVSHNGTRTEFRSQAEIDSAIAQLSREIEAAQGNTIRRQIRMYQDGKGL